MANPKDDTAFDTRILTHQLRRGILTKEEIDAKLAELPDEAEEAVESSVRFTTPYADRLHEERGGR